MSKDKDSNFDEEMSGTAWRSGYDSASEMTRGHDPSLPNSGGEGEDGP